MPFKEHEARAFHVSGDTEPVYLENAQRHFQRKIDELRKNPKLIKREVNNAIDRYFDETSDDVLAFSYISAPVASALFLKYFYAEPLEKTALEKGPSYDLVAQTCFGINAIADAVIDGEKAFLFGETYYTMLQLNEVHSIIAPMQSREDFVEMNFDMMLRANQRSVDLLHDTDGRVNRGLEPEDGEYKDIRDIYNGISPYHSFRRIDFDSNWTEAALQGAKFGRRAFKIAYPKAVKVTDARSTW